MRAAPCFLHTRASTRRGLRGRESVATDNLLAELRGRGVSRRDFLKLCSAVAAVLGLTGGIVPKIAHALETKKKPILVWVECQSCGPGDTQALLKAVRPDAAELFFDVLSLDYSEAIMAAAGHQA